MTAIEAPDPAGGMIPPTGGVPDADQTELPIPAVPTVDADTSTTGAADAGIADAGIAEQATDPALDLAERLLALQYGNPAQRDLAGFILCAIDAAENTEINPFEDGREDGENADSDAIEDDDLRGDRVEGDARGLGDARRNGEDDQDDDRDAELEPVPADVLAYRAGVAGIDAYESLASAVQAGKARLIAHTYAHSRAALRHGDVSPGQVIKHADGAVDRIMTSSQILATDLGFVLHAPTGLVSNHITEATQLVHHMPRTLARLESGELTTYHWHLISRHVHRLTPEQADVLDEVVSGRSFRGTGSYIGLGQDRATTKAVKRRLDRALDQIGWEPPSKAKRKSGFNARYVGIGPVGEDGMTNLYGLLPAVHARAIDTLLTDLAKTAPDGDERTVEQRRADVFLTLFTGPAALAPPLQTELDLSAPSFDDEGQYTVVDPAQNLYAYEVWETIRLLAASLGLTFPDVPRAVINLDSTLETLERAQSLADHLAKTGSPPRATCSGEVCPEPPDPGSAGDVCPDSPHDRRPPRSGVETTKGADVGTTSGTGASKVETAKDANASTTNGSEADAILHALTSTYIADAVQNEDSARLRAATVRGVGDIPDQLAARLLRHADLRRIITDPITGQPLEVGRRRPNTALRNAVLNRDRTCRFPGCERVPLSMELDHIAPFDDTKPAAGQTVPHNLECLCKMHHRAKHQLQWTPVMNEDNTITWRNNLLQIIATT